MNYKGALAIWDTAAGAYVRLDYTVEIDQDELARLLLYRASRSKSGKATTNSRSVTLQITKKETVI